MTEGTARLPDASRTGLDDLFGPLRAFVSSGVRRALGPEPESFAVYEQPPGDPGLFGPDSVAWRVHSDLPAMLIGGVSALFHQMLHPLAMAGVAEHSSYKSDPFGRLRRTAQFVAGTTYGPLALAEELIGHVRSVHQRVVGVAPDGRRYAAFDPELLRFVHTTEVDGFLRSYQRYGRVPLLGKETDRYFAEMREIAERLGAKDVPDSRSAVRDYLREIRRELSLTEQAREAVSFLLRPASSAITDQIGHRIITGAAIDLLAVPVREMLGLADLALVQAGPRRLAAVSFARTLRWAIGPPVLRAIATRRTEAAKSPAGREDEFFRPASAL